MDPRMGLGMERTTMGSGMDKGLETEIITVGLETAKIMYLETMTIMDSVMERTTGSEITITTGSATVTTTGSATATTTVSATATTMASVTATTMASVTTTTGFTKLSQTTIKIDNPHSTAATEEPHLKGHRPTATDLRDLSMVVAASTDQQWRRP